MVLSGVAKHQVLHHEFDIDNAAVIVFQVEQRTFVGVCFMHFVAHFEDAIAQGVLIARRTEDFAAELFESMANGSVAGDGACSRQRLVFP